MIGKILFRLRKVKRVVGVAGGAREVPPAKNNPTEQ